MNIEEKATVFDLLVRAMTNRWSDGRWSWFCRTPCGGESRETREEAIADLIEWAKRPINQRDKSCADAVQDTVELSTEKLRAPDANG